jgi:hypothetical protein
MTTHEQVISGIIDNHYGEAHAHLTDDELLVEMEHIGAILDGFKNTLGHLEQEAYRRIEERGATSIPSETYICEMETGFKYDQASFGPLKEVFNEVDLKKCLTPAHTDEVKIADKWATATVKSLATKYGAEAMRILDNARMESRGRLKFARRETK